MQFELKPLVCERCGGSIDRRTMKCPYCDTQYERRNDGVTVNYVVEPPGTHKIQASVRADKYLMARDPAGYSEHVLKMLRNELAEGLLAYMKITTSEDLSFYGDCQIIRGEVRVVDPAFSNY